MSETNTNSIVDLSGLNFDLSDLSDMPAAVQQKFAERQREASGPSENQHLVSAILNSVPGKIAMTAAQVLVLVRRAQNMSPDVDLPETTVRGWLNGAVERGMIAKATGKSGFCAVDSEFKASAEELAERSAKVRAAHEAAAAKRKAEAAKVEESRIASATDDPFAGLGM